MSFRKHYRDAMIEMRKRLPHDAPPKVCFTCAGWEHFGGVNSVDMTKGPMCVCDKTWNAVMIYLSEKIKLLAI